MCRRPTAQSYLWLVLCPDRVSLRRGLYPNETWFRELPSAVIVAPTPVSRRPTIRPRVRTARRRSSNSPTITMHPALATALSRIAVREGCDRSALPPVYEAVDPEALAAVLESSTDVSVRFEYGDYRVAIGPGPHEVAVIDGDR